MTVYMAREQCRLFGEGIQGGSVVVIGLYSTEQKAKDACDSRAKLFFTRDDGTISSDYQFSAWEADQVASFRTNKKHYFQIVTKEEVQ